MSLAVHMQGIEKRFGAVVALDSVDLHVRPQTIHGLVGENGAGKTTLMRILYGAAAPDAGAIALYGERVFFGSTKQAIRAGVGMVSQHYAIIPELTCLQNLMLGAEDGPILDVRGSEAKAESLAGRMGFKFDWNRPAAELSPAGAQKLEILKLLWREARVMILDEPTAMLSPGDSEALFASLHLLTKEGATVILVTHRLPEVLEHCSTVTVLRGGKLVAEKSVSETSAGELARLIVGTDLAKSEPHVSRGLGEPVLDVEDLVVKGDRGDLALKGVSLAARAGEILGIAGVDGNGQRELIQAIAGVRPVVSGRVEVCGHLGGSTRSRLLNGLRIIPEDRHEEGVVEAWSLEENAALGLQRFPPLAKGFRIDKLARRKWAQTVAGMFNTKHGGLAAPMASLSGGNQQRFVAARALGFAPRLVLGFQPARGLDIGGTLDLYTCIRKACDEGAAAVVVSFDLEELLEHCDRIAVLNAGAVLSPEPGKERDRDAIGRLMVGAD